MTVGWEKPRSIQSHIGEHGHRPIRSEEFTTTLCGTSERDSVNEHSTRLSLAREDVICGRWKHYRLDVTMADYPSIPATRFSIVATFILKQGDLCSLSVIFELGYAVELDLLIIHFSSYRVV